MKKGFTLVELLAIIMVLAVLALIITPIVSSTITKSKKNAYDNQVRTLKIAAESWGIDNKLLLPEEENDFLELTIEDLKKENYIDIDIKNPLTGKCISNAMKIKIIREKNRYVYEIDGDIIDGTNVDCTID